MDGDSFNPQLFVNFIKLLNELNEIHQDCADASDTLFQTGERIPLWARQNTAEIKDDTVAIMQSNERNWNKVIVMDPPIMVAVDSTQQIEAEASESGVEKQIAQQ